MRLLFKTKYYIYECGILFATMQLWFSIKNKYINSLSRRFVIALALRSVICLLHSTIFSSTRIYTYIQEKYEIHINFKILKVTNLKIEKTYSIRKKNKIQISIFFLLKIHKLLKKNKRENKIIF